MFKPTLEVLEDRTKPSFSVLPPEINSARMYEGAVSEAVFAATVPLR